MTIHTVQPVIMTGDAISRKPACDEVASAVTDESSLGATSLFGIEIDGAADVRWEKIAALRARIAAGTYRIASVEIAARMMEAVTC